MNIMDSKMVVYCYTNKINGKKYIGITKCKLLKRHNEHILESKNKNRKEYNYPFNNAIRKYGIENFELEILKFCDTVEELKKYEQYYILEYNTFIHSTNSNGYNGTTGGDGVGGLSGKNHPMYGKKGKNNPNYGKNVVTNLEKK